MAQNKTEQYLRTTDIDKKIVSSIDNGIIVIDNKLKIHHYNKWLELHTQIKESTIIGKYIHDVFPDINKKTLQRKTKTALLLQTPTFYTASTSHYLIPIKINQIKNSGFDYMQQDVSIIPFDKENELVALVLTDQTIMANTNALLETKIDKIKELNAELIKERDTINEKIIYLKLDNDAQITKVSQAHLNLTHFTREEMLGLNFFEYENLHLANTLKKEILEHMKALKVFKFKEKTLNYMGKELWLKNSLVPEFNYKGEHLGFILFREDISSEKLAEENHEKLLANSRSAAMGDMISMIAHQWRQPLTLINTIISTVKIKKELNALSDTYLDQSHTKIEETILYLSQTIDDFRDYFKPQKVVSEVDLKDLFEKSVFFLTKDMSLHNIQYILEVPEQTKIYTYKNELLQSIINILKNSIDAYVEQKNSDAPRKINVLILKQDTQVSISIEDNAGGISQEVLKKVFEPYFSTKSKNGTGIGLFMCKTIIDEHLFGHISMSSSTNKTNTHIELPYVINGENQNS